MKEIAVLSAYSYDDRNHKMIITLDKDKKVKYTFIYDGILPWKKALRMRIKSLGYTLPKKINIDSVLEKSFQTLE